ncbi:MAG: hypothetical protein IPJ28_21830 [Betaproteobacteria bacterium]|nr:hypothetical protein [Betaproteobacteria bacterium]
MDPRGSAADPVGNAIHRVLEAEREAQADIVRARTASDVRLAAARAEALLASANADRRLAAARAGVDARIARREAGIEAAIRALEAEGLRDTGEEDRVRRAAQAIAAALTGEESP